MNQRLPTFRPQKFDQSTLVNAVYGLSLLGTKEMESNSPPRAGEISATCPNPDLVACRRTHFGREVWHFECAQAVEVSVMYSAGIVIKCSGLDGFCCVEDGEDVFVDSPDISSFKAFLETTMSYLGLK